MQIEQRETHKAIIKRNLLRALRPTGPWQGTQLENLIGNELFRSASKADNHRETLTTHTEECSLLLPSKQRRSYREQTAPTPSNRKLTRSAIIHSCCPGDIFARQRETALRAIDALPSACTFIVLLTPVSHTLLGLYEFHPDSESVHKVCGFGVCPDYLHADLVQCYYRYDSGVRDFRKVQRKGFSLAIDAVTLKSAQSRKQKKDI